MSNNHQQLELIDAVRLEARRLFITMAKRHWQEVVSENAHRFNIDFLFEDRDHMTREQYRQKVSRRRNQ
jgi:hypothetical protein